MKPACRRAGRTKGGNSCPEVMEQGRREADKDADVWEVLTPLVRAGTASVRNVAIGRRMRPGSRATRRLVRSAAPD